ncbi:MAG: (2Fe-2S)-binding protein [Pyrinomonadaceae bacterium]|nr:(2Fe-2S)-binding protein [Pyrinomonadaceae bacterium]
MKSVGLTIDGEEFEFAEGTSVAAAVLNSGRHEFRRSVTGSARSAFCGMGVCYECRVTIDGVGMEKSCQIYVAQGMRIQTDGNY